MLTNLLYLPGQTERLHFPAFFAATENKPLSSSLTNMIINGIYHF